MSDFFLGFLGRGGGSLWSGGMAVAGLGGEGVLLPTFFLLFASRLKRGSFASWDALTIPHAGHWRCTRTFARTCRAFISQASIRALNTMAFYKGRGLRDKVRGGL